MDAFFCCILSTLFIYQSFTVAEKVDIQPPGELLVHIANNYLKISDVVLTTHENSSINVDDYADLLHNNGIPTSLFEWRVNVNIDDQFTQFLKVAKNRKYKIVFFLDYESTEIFFQYAPLVRDRVWLVCLYRWVFFDFEGVDIRSVQHVNTSAVCWRGIYVTKKDNSNESEDVGLILYGATFTRKGHCLLRDHIADWTPSTGLENTTIFRRRITNFKNRTFPASVLNEQPFYGTTKEGKHEGMEYEIMKTLREKLNFRTTYIPSTDGEFGYQLPNGTWTGYVGLITSGKSLFSMAVLSISNRRMQAIDFSSPYIFGKLSFVVISPSLESRKLVLIKPLQEKVWTALVATLFICTITLYLITHSLPCKSGVRRSYNILFLLRTLGQQGTPSPAPARYSIRIFIGSWWFFIMVILWSYAGTLTSFMTYPGHRPAIDTVKKLQNALRSGSIRYGTLKGTSYERFLKEDLANDDPIFAQSLEENPDCLVRSVRQGMDHVLKGKFAFVYIKTVLKWFAATLGFDRFRFSKNVFSTEAIGIAIQKCHPLKRSFDHIVDRLEETGLLSKWYNDAFVKASIQAPKVDINSVRPLSLDDLQGAFYFLGICHLTSTTMFFLEIIVANILFYKRKARKKKKKIYYW